MATRSGPFPFLRGVLFAALLVAALPGVTSERTRAKEPLGLPAAEIYAADSPGTTALAPLDALTLDPRPDRPSIDLGSVGQESLPVVSADGSTLAFLANDATIVVRAGLLGPERLRFAPDGTVGDLVLSRDGRRLVAYVVNDDSVTRLHPPAWKVFDTVRGRLLTTIQGGEGAAPWGWEGFVVDPDARRLYRLASADRSVAVAPEKGPHPTVLIAHDLATGAEVGRLDLPQVYAGSWQSAESVAIGDGREPLMKQLIPALAISPDGRRLAIVHADDEGLTLIDTERLAVERTDSLMRAASAWSQLVALLPLVPETASAKALEGTMLQAVFAPDGRRLYVYGVRASVESGEPVFRGLGLRTVDVNSGEVEALALEEAPIERVVPSPDGGSLFVAGPESDATADADSSATPYLIRRVDARTLEIVAERSFPEWRWFVVRSTLADPVVPLTVELVEMAFVPSVVTVPANTPVRLTVANHGTVPHSFRTGDEETGQWDVRIDLAPGETETVTIEARVGEYKLFCDVAEHASMGMGGAIVAR